MARPIGAPVSHYDIDWFGDKESVDLSPDEVRFEAWGTIAHYDEMEARGQMLDETERWLRDTLVKQHGRDPRNPNPTVPRFQQETKNGEVT